MSRAPSSLPALPDCDDALRRLSDVLQIPLTCRKTRCRREGLCQGGFGPPCYFENRQDFVEGVSEQIQEYREYWGKRRKTLRAGLLG